MKSAADGQRPETDDRVSSGAPRAKPAMLPSGPPRQRKLARRITTVIALLLVAVTLAGASFGYLYAAHYDERQEAEHRQALLAAVDEYRAAFGVGPEVDPRLARVLERTSGLKDLKFEPEPEPSDEKRVLQSISDPNGRIVGWFSWDADRPMTEIMERLSPLLAGFALCFIAFALMALRQMRSSARELADSEAETYRFAREDLLTGLPNNRRMLEMLEAELTNRKQTKVLSFAFLDLEGFKDINNAIGREGADAVLAEVAVRLQAAMPEGSLIGRFGGDEFAVAFMADDADAAVRTLRAAVGAVSRPIWMDQMILVGISAGVAQVPRDAKTSEELMRRADLALLASKRKGRGLVMRFEPELETEIADRHFVFRELKRAISEQTLQVHYQPIVAAAGSRIVGVEALARWTHPIRGSIPPTVFVEVAEQNGLMEELGAFVLRQALTDSKRWPDLFICVNLSPIQVRDRTFVQTLANILSETGVDPARVVLEITEGVLIQSPDDARDRLQKMRALGVRIALDDFGSGYSSLGYLQKFPIDKLKIDKSFVEPLGRSSNAGVIIQAIVALGRALNLSVLVEGVETEEQRVLLRLAGCDEMQGFLFARPAARETIDRLLIDVKAAKAAG